MTRQITGDLLVINNEVMKVISKDNNSKYTVQRFNNTEPKKHLTGASVKKTNKKPRIQ